MVINETELVGVKIWLFNLQKWETYISNIAEATQKLAKSKDVNSTVWNSPHENQ